MKRILPILMLLILIAPVSALTINEAGLTPDNPLWNFEIGMERVQLFFQINKQTKIEMATRFAEERLVEIQKLELRKETQTISEAKYQNAVMIANNNRLQNIQLAEKEATTEQLKEQLQERLKIQEETHQQTMEQVKQISSEYNQTRTDVMKEIIIKLGKK